MKIEKLCAGNHRFIRISSKEEFDFRYEKVGNYCPPEYKGPGIYLDRFHANDANYYVSDPVPWRDWVDKLRKEADEIESAFKDL